MQGPIVVVNGDSDRIAHDDMTIESFTGVTTRYLAAQLIAAPRFPERWLLPRLRAPAFTNLGHQLLVDYPQLATIVWRVALDASAAARRVRNHRLLAAIGVPAAGLGILLLTTLSSRAKAIGVLIMLIAGIVIKLLKARQDRIAHDAVADIRANALTRLSQNEWTRQEPPVTVTAQIGNGALGQDHAPVLVMLNPKHPFPGFGKLQLEQPFICRPKTDAHQQEIAELTGQLHARIADKIREHSRAVFRAGEVVVLDGHTLSMQSPWLGTDKAPRLWLPREELSEIHHLDPRATCRVFHASQILIPGHATVATFFVRVYAAGSSVTFHIAASTLGPPMTGPAGIAARMRRHQVDVRHRMHQPAVTLEAAHTSAERAGMVELVPAALANDAEPAFQEPLDLRELVDLNPDDEIKRHPRGPYEHAVAAISRDSAMWPGRALATNLLREAGSYAVTPSFFGQPEALSVIRTVYDQAVRAALETVDDAGFDISDYRDRDGRFTINADKIGQLVVSDQVTMSNGDRSSTEHKKEQRNEEGRH